MTVDVGASVGNFAMASARAVGRRGRVLALEPNPEVFAELVNSTWGAPVTPLNLAASDRRGVASFAVPTDEGGSAVPPLGSLESRPGPHDTFLVRTVLLDELLPPHSEVSALKIDVEGHELAVLQGAAETIERCGPAIIIEIENRHLAESVVEDVVHWIVDRNYRGWGVRGDDLLPWREFDAHEWQDRWLTQNADGTVDIGAGYVNNFLFLRR
ncbi:FkbM family methyltransferase [Nocardioides sp. SYSU DS0663]|uniref:FkbM family methyltransferase n=1 Tax=Nocardioides sp. SYSU DS0663 TaxID=3416445 RepID=UPI003F4C7F67